MLIILIGQSSWLSNNNNAINHFLAVRENELPIGKQKHLTLKLNDSETIKKFVPRKVLDITFFFGSVLSFIALCICPYQ